MILPAFVTAGVVGALYAIKKTRTPAAPAASPTPPAPPASAVGHPYRGQEPAAVGPRWGATRWMKRYVRLQQLLDPVSMHLRKRRASRSNRADAIALCWDQIQRDAQLGQRPACTCNEHYSHIVLPPWMEIALHWNKGEPVTGSMRWHRKGESCECCEAET